MTPDCRNHVDLAATQRCGACAEPFCGDCLVAIGGATYCASCKVVAVDGSRSLEAATVPCKEADHAFVVSMVGIFLFQIPCGAVAVILGRRARKEIRAYPRLHGWGKANAAIVLGAIELAIAFLNFAATAS